MNIEAFAFGTTNWGEVENRTSRETGIAYWRTQFLATSRTKSVCEWLNIPCATLRIIGAVKVMSFYAGGELETLLADGRKFTLTAGMSYQVGDNAEPHQSERRQEQNSLLWTDGFVVVAFAMSALVLSSRMRRYCFSREI